jgi:hypothetical protein
MAISPLVMPPGSSEKSASSRNLKPPPKQTVAEASNGGADLAEQMNEMEKRKYVKGLPLDLIQLPG